MTYKVWVASGISDGSLDVEVVYITSDHKDILDKIKKMGSEVLAFNRVEGGDVSEGLERTSSPSPLSPLIFEVPL